MSLNHLIIPNSIHTEPWLLNTTSCHPRQKLILPPIHLHPPLLIIRDSQPLITPIARRHGIRVTSAGRRWVQANLPLDAPARPELERSNVPRQIEAVGPRRGKEVLAREAQRAHVGTVQALARVGVLGRDPGRDEWVAVVRVDGCMGGWVDDILAQPVAGFHQGVEVLACGVDGDPARVVAWIGRIDRADEFDGAIWVLAVRPQLVGCEIGGVEIGLGWVKDHAVDARVGLVGVILRVL